jgi:N-acetylneuraminic acid mutarotase
MIVWGGSSSTSAGQFLDDGGIYNPVTNSWAQMSVIGAPAGRTGHTVIWTGSKMLVWGGSGSNGILGDGGTYDPATDTWSAISSTGAPTARYAHVGIWTGTKMIIWGGWGLVQNISGNSTMALADGGIYDPATDTWTTISAVSAPTARAAASAVWTGLSMIVWGGEALTSPSRVGYFNDGASYTP